MAKADGPEEFSLETVAEIDREIDKLDQKNVKLKLKVKDINDERDELAAERAKLVERRAAVYGLRQSRPGDITVGAS